MKKRIGTILVCILLIASSSVIVTPVESLKASRNTVYVDDDNISGPWDGTQEHPYQHIQDAVNNASDSDTIYVYSGIYNERIKINKTLFIFGLVYDTNIGNDFGKPIIDSNGTGPIFYVKADSCIIDGFVTRHAGDKSQRWGGFDIYSKSCNISNNECRGYSYSGIYIESSAENIMIYNNTIKGVIIGISCWGKGTNISKNKISNSGWAIESTYDGDTMIYRNIICDNNRGIYSTYGGSRYIINNNISNNRYNGIQLRIPLKKNIIKGNIICNNYEGSGIYLLDFSNGIIDNNTICANKNNGITIYKTADGTSKGNIILNNTIKSNQVFQIEIHGDTKKISYNTINNNEFLGEVEIWWSDNNIISNNNFINGGLDIIHSEGNNVTNNWINNKSLVYLEGISFKEVKDAGQVILVNCESIDIKNQNLSNIGVGIQLFNSKGCSIINNKITNNELGLRFFGSNWNFISKNNFLNNDKNAIFYDCYINQWRRNYWDKPRFLPMPIFGYMGYFIPIPWFNFDWFPVKKPYDIPIPDVP